MKWNSDIRKTMDEKFIAENEEVKDLVNDWLPTTILVVGTANTDNVDEICYGNDDNIYEYETDDDHLIIHELQTYSMTDSHYAYYRYVTNENEEEYKKRRMNFLLNDINKILDEYNKRISEMTKQTKIFTEFKKMILNQ
jgi:hypothetical protein